RTSRTPGSGSRTRGSGTPPTAASWRGGSPRSPLARSRRRLSTTCTPSWRPAPSPCSTATCGSCAAQRSGTWSPRAPRPVASSHDGKGAPAPDPLTQTKVGRMLVHMNKEIHMAETGLLTILRGLPGSGKSTYAQHEAGERGAVVLSRDSLRDMLHPDGHTGVLEGFEEVLISETLRAMAVRLLGEGRHVIIDATNLRDKYVRDWIKVAHGRGHDFSIVDFRDESLEQCLANNRHRERQVPEGVIWGMYQRLVRGRDLATENERIAAEVV